MYPLTLIRLNKNKKINLVLRNNTKITGILDGWDSAMNLLIKNANIVLMDNTQYFADEAILKGQFIKLFNLNSWVLSKQNLFDKENY